jgi:hypothetical protein
MRATLALLAAITIASPCLISAQTINGRVVDAITRQPVGGAELRLMIADVMVANAVSDSAGQFRLAARRQGRYQILATRLGYADAESRFIELMNDQTVNAELVMSSQAVKLAPLTLNVPRDRYLESKGFYERMQSGTGDFLTGPEIQKRNTLSLVELLRGMRGVKIQRINNSRQEVYFAGANCHPVIVLDGVTVRYGGRNVGTQQTLDDLVPVAHLDAVEVYRGGSGVPPEYEAPNASCGVILLWTRHK